MSNCLVAQSGGPTSVINATLAGIVKANQLNPYYDHVYGGLNGIEGVMNDRLYDLTNMSEEENRLLKQTPSSALGSCRYKLKRDCEDDFKLLFDILDKHDIETFFYIGGNDSMDTVAALNEYAENNKIKGHRFVGCPKTVDNDLLFIDHCPGYASAAKYIATTALETWLDFNVYTRQEVFILETMGRDAGWLAASACLSKHVDILILPEVAFDAETFLKKVAETVRMKNKCYIVVSEGAKDSNGNYLASSGSKNDGFAHEVLGGAANALKEMIIKSGAANRVKVQDLSNAQRCYAPMQSLIDVEEAYRLGLSAHMHSINPNFSGKMVALRRRKIDKYDVEFFTVDADKVANFVKTFPLDWILKDYNGISDEAIAYIKPLIEGEPVILYKDGLPQYIKPYYMR